MTRKVVRRGQEPRTSDAGRSGAAMPRARSSVQSRRLRINWTWVGIGAGVLLVLALFVWWALRPTGAVADEQRLPDEGRAHVEPGSPIVYRNNPPASGTHYPTVASWGVHEEEVPEGEWVHNLEHGGIVLLYKCPEGTCPERISQLQALYNRAPRSKWNNVKLAAVPYENMEPEFMAIAWNVQLPLEEFDQEAILTFYGRHVDRGPEDAP